MNNFSETFFVICLTRVQKMLIFKYNFKIRDMYSLDCNYYKKSFSTLQELIDDVQNSGMDPNYEVTCDGVGIFQYAIDFMCF